MPQTVYFALAFGQPGCIPSEPIAFAVSTRGEVRDAIASMFQEASEGRAALREFGLRDAWQWAKRNGFSSYHREIRLPRTSEVLNFMGLTEAEYLAYDVED